MQLLSKSFYFSIMPFYMGKVRLGCHAINKLFSYGVDDDMLWIYNCEDRDWTRVKPTFITKVENKKNEPSEFHLNHSMQIGVASSINKVYFLGGSFDKNFNEISDLTMEWSLKDNTV